MRVFIAVDLPKEIKDEIYRIQKSINSKYATINWVSKKNLHLSLKFLGEYDNLNLLKEKISNITFNKFKVKLSKFDVFPDYFNIRIMLIGLEPKDKVIELQKKLDQELINIFNREQKFSPHLTIGRVKVIKNKKEFVDSLKNINVEDLEFEINEFYLMESKLTKNGPIYKKLEMFKA